MWPSEYGSRRYSRYQIYLLFKEIDTLLSKIIPANLAAAAIELKVYINDSFGSNQRIDYGTGHELAFLLFLYCLQ
jgi:serine/threonine-protein phosphatase 2A activator